MPATVLFLLVLLAWAVYLAQHWIRRREHVATMDAVDRFSVAMRVLRRRDVALADAPSTSRAVLSGPAMSRPAMSRPVASRPVAGRRRVAHGGPASVRLAHGGSAAPETVAAPAPAVASAGGLAGVASAARTGRRGPTPLQRALAWLLLISVVAIPVTVVLAWRHVLVWASVPAALAVGAVSLGALVFLARRRRATSAAVRRNTPSAGDSAGDSNGAAPANVGGGTAAPVVSAAPGAPAVAPEPEPGTWTPTRVPTPTYLLKDTAPPVYRPRSAVTDAPVRAQSTPPAAARAVGD